LLKVVGSRPAIDAPRTIGGRYELEDLLGEGGIGQVWRARHIALNSHVAIKFLQGGSAVAESTKRRFAAEAQITAQLKTPNAVQVFDFGVTDEGQPYLVMELLEGETLGSRIDRLGRLGIAETIRLLGPCARALDRAHKLGIIHRDFKPENVIICGDEHEGNELVKVLDFGLAKLAGALGDGPDASRPVAASSRDLSKAGASLTETGIVLGTPLYMAPEQARDAQDVDLRADVWAFGVVAFECLTGLSPFRAPTVTELFAQINAGVHSRAIDLRPSLPPAFDAWFDTACAHDPEKRFPSAGTAWKELALALGAETSIPPSFGPRLQERNERVLAETTDEPRKVPTVPPRGRRIQSTLATFQRVTRQALGNDASDASPRALERTSLRPAVRSAWTRSKLTWAVASVSGLLVVVASWQLATHKPGSSSAAPARPNPPPATAPLEPSRPTASAAAQARRPLAAPRSVLGVADAVQPALSNATSSASAAQSAPLPPPPPPAPTRPAAAPESAPSADPGR
jgi:serine/threonine-protein kinase